MKAEFYIARRFAFKPRSLSKPTFIVLASIVGIAVGTAALILTLSIVKGFATVIEGKLISFTSHLQVRQPDDRFFPETRHDLQKLHEVPGISTASPFIEMNVMLRGRTKASGTEGEVVPAVVKGISPEEANHFYSRHLVAGSYPQADSSGTLKIVLGKTMAETMGLRTGSRVMIIGLGKNGDSSRFAGKSNVVDLLSSLDIELATVAGIYETGLNEGFDDIVVFADLNRLQQRFHPGMISGYEANVNDLRKLPAVSADVSRTLGYPFFTYTVYERYANLFEWLKLQKNIMPLLIITITVVAVFNIVSTLLVLIIEKTKEIGMLSALGLEPRSISTVFMAQAFMIAVVGIGSGNLLALGLSLFEQRFHLITLPEKSYFIKHVPILIDPADYLLVSCGVALLALLFSFIPSRVAASLRPGVALSA
jgi:lipoprotein-releasing system permease protein